MDHPDDETPGRHRPDSDAGPDGPTGGSRWRIVQATFAAVAVCTVLAGLAFNDLAAEFAAWPSGERTMTLRARLAHERAINSQMSDRIAALEDQIASATPVPTPPGAKSDGGLPAPVAPPAILTPETGRGVPRDSFGLALATVDSPAAAMALWQTLAARAGDMLDNYRPHLAVTGESEAGYRIVIGPFRTRIAADLTCGELRAREIGCSPTVFTGQPLTLAAQ